MTAKGGVSPRQARHCLKGVVGLDGGRIQSFLSISALSAEPLQSFFRRASAKRAFRAATCKSIRRGGLLLGVRLQHG